MGTSLVAQLLRLCDSTAVGMGSVPDQGAKIPYAARQGKKQKKKKEKGERNLCVIRTMIGIHLSR